MKKIELLNISIDQSKFLKNERDYDMKVAAMQHMTDEEKEIFSKATNDALVCVHNALIRMIEESVVEKE